MRSLADLAASRSDEPAESFRPPGFGVRRRLVVFVSTRRATMHSIAGAAEASGTVDSEFPLGSMGIPAGSEIGMQSVTWLSSTSP